MYRIQKFLHGIPEQGLNQRIYLRKRDSLKSLAQSVNHMMTKLEFQHNKDKEALGKVHERLTGIKSELEKRNPSIGSLKEGVREISGDLALLE